MSRPKAMAATPYLGAGTLLAGRYEILGEIGRGGYSVVYAARDRELDSEVAIKLLVPPPADAHIARERMRREVNAVRGLSHPNILAVHDFLEEGHRSFIVMERVHGPDLLVRLKERGPLDVDEVVKIGNGVASALSLAHGRGILHRDVKPQNILLEDDGRARLTDFGSARLEGQSSLTRTGGLVGTLNYAAPELVEGQRGDGRSDVYALGMTLYFALTGELPESPSPHLPPLPAPGGYRPRSVRRGVPVWLDDSIARATAASPVERFPTASSLADALERRDVRAAGALRRPLEACVICGAPEPLGLPVCPRCGGTSKGAADTLIFARRPMYSGDREAVTNQLRELVRGQAQPTELMDVAAGYRALVRVPAAAVKGVVEQLGRRRIPARAVRAARAWAPMPFRFYGLLVVVVGVGGAAGLSALPMLTWFSPLLAGGLMLVAQRRMQTPVVALPERAAELPPAVEKKVIQTFAHLPSGTARGLLADLVRMAQRIHSTASASAEHAEMTEQLSELLTHSCDAAIDLSDLDENLVQLESQRGRLGELPPNWIDAVAHGERTRDRLVQTLLEMIALLARARRHSSAFLVTGGEQLTALAREIDRHCESHAAAAREIEQLLGASG